MREKLKDTEISKKAFRSLLSVIMEDDSIYVSPAKSEADLGKRLVYISENSSKKRENSLCNYTNKYSDCVTIVNLTLDTTT